MASSNKLTLFFGIADASPGEKFNAPLVAALEVVSHIMLKMMGYVMYIAPLAIFAAISSVIATEGRGILLLRLDDLKQPSPWPSP